MGVKVIGWVLADQRREVAVHGVLMCAMRLHLNGDVGNAEI